MMYSAVLEKDFKSIEKKLFDSFTNKSVLITGATGLIGSLVVRYLLMANEFYGLNCQVIALVRNQEKANRIFTGYNATLLNYIVGDLKSGFTFEGGISPDYILHTAAITASKEMITRPADVIELSVEGTRAVLRLAVASGAKMVYLSSMEVYGTVKREGKTKEDELGYIDILAPRSSYPESKRLCEALCAAYATQYDVRVTLARLANTFGAGVLPGEGRAFFRFAKSALCKEDIVLRTEGLSEGNYVYTADAVAAILLLLTKGASGEAYNVSNEASHTTIKGMAQIAADTLSGGEAKIVVTPVEREKTGYAPDVKLFLDSSKLCCLGWKPLVALPEAFERLGLYIAEQGL